MGNKAKSTERDIRIATIINQLQERPYRVKELAKQFKVTPGLIYNDIFEIGRDIEVTKRKKDKYLVLSIDKPVRDVKNLQCFNRKNTKQKVAEFSVSKSQIEKDLKKDFIDHGITVIQRYQLIDWYCRKYLGRGCISTMNLKKLCNNLGLDIIYGIAM